MEAEEVLLRTSAKWLQVICVTFPTFVCQSIPKSAEVLSWASLYVFIQSLGLLWVFLVSLSASLSLRSVAAVVSKDGGASLILETPCQVISVAYVYYAVMRVLFLFGQSLWTSTWEVYHNFPTMRVLLLRKRHAPIVSSVLAETSVDAAASSGTKAKTQESVERNIRSRSGRFAMTDEKSGEFDDHPRAKALKNTVVFKDTRRQVVLIMPLLVIVMCNFIMLVGQSYCSGHGCSGTYLFEPTGRVNRNVRFVLFVSTLQWIQAFVAVFPTWYEALTNQGHRFIPGVMLFCLIPASLLRLAAWFVKPAGSGVTQSVIGITHYTVDSVLVILSSVWLLMTCLVVLGRRGIAHSGFSWDVVNDDAKWNHLCSLYKYTLFLWMGLHYLRGSIGLGPVHAQNDMIAISMFYPFLICLIWTVTFMAVALTRYTVNQEKTCWQSLMLYFMGMAAVFGVTYQICCFANRGSSYGLMMFVWVHLGRQIWRIARRWVRLAYVTHKEKKGESKVAPPKPLSFALHPKNSPEMAASYKAERRIGRVAVRSLMLVCTGFSFTLTVCMLMAHIQNWAGLFLTDVVWWKELSGGVQITNTGASVLTLSPLTSSAETALSAAEKEEDPAYAICGHTFEGLQLVDYALMSAITYMDVKPSSGFGQPLLEHLFPHKIVNVTRVSNNINRRWVEVEFKTCTSNGADHCKSVRVIAISGTDPTHIIDFVEDMRMWTEPVCLTLLSTFFPTVRAWPRGTTAMVIGGIHDVLGKMHLADDDWHYTEILEHVRQYPKSQKVVITGHSLGGGMALIVGALSGRLAVALQPPGVYHSLAKHQAQQADARTSFDALHERSVSLVVEGDWVQHFDAHGGLVQTMSCDQTEMSVGLGCHLLEGTICHLLRHCGDRAQRWSSCQHAYEPRSTAMTAAQVGIAIAKSSSTVRDLSKHWDSVLLASTVVSAALVARFGAPDLRAQVAASFSPTPKS